MRKNTICTCPIFFYLLLEERRLNNLLSSEWFSDDGAAFKGDAKMRQIGKMWTLTSKIWLCQRYPNFFLLEIGKVFHLMMFIEWDIIGALR